MPPYRAPLRRALRSIGTTSLLAVLLVAGGLALPVPGSAQSAPDLALVSIALSPSVVRVGDVVTALVTVRNAGGRATDPSTIDLLAARLGDYSLAGVSTLGTVSVGALAPGGSVQLPLSFTAPPLAPGYLNVTAQADPRNLLVEAYETNNRASRLLEITRPDLMVTAISLASVGQANDTVNGVVTVRNVGRVPADASTLGLSLIRNPGAIESGIDLGTRPVAPLAPGASVQIPVTFTVPAVPPGSFYVVARADVMADLAETLDSNNHRLSYFQVVLPDLVVDSVTVAPSTARAGDTVSVHIRVRNQARVPAKASEGAVYFVTSQASVLEGATSLMTFPVAALMPGASAQTTLSLPVPAAAAGSYMVVARADSAGGLEEASESNNLRGTVLRLAVPALAIAGFTATPASVAVGETIRGSISIYNRGAVSSNPTSASLYVATSPDADLVTASHVATVPVPAVPAYRLTTLTVPVVVPFLAQGSQYLIVQLDAIRAVGGARSTMIASIDPTGPPMQGPRSAVRFTISLPDLTVSALSLSSTQLRSGATMTAVVTVRNAGSALGAASLSALLMGGCAGTTGSEIHTVHTLSIPALPPGASTSQTITAAVPSLDPGSYCLTARADAAAGVRESSETNNDRSVPVSILPATPSPQPGALSDHVDPSQLDMPWPKHSHYKQPWRAWLETVPATRLRTGVGINYNWDKHRDNDAVELRLLAQAGFSRIRVGVGWNQIDYDTLDLTDAARAKLTAIVAGARAVGIRPLILLNAHHGGPGPSRAMTRTVRTAAAAGSRSVQLDNIAGIQTGYTGISNLTAYKMAEVFITAVNPSTSTVTLSKPLPVSLAAGRTLRLDTLRYRPFYPPGTSQFEATAAGWLEYVRAVLRTVVAAGLSSFDVEIWNELTFGTDFLGINAYYDPPPVPGLNYLDSRPGSSAWELGRRTVAMLATEFPGVKPIWGFSNTSFFNTPVADLPPGMRGQSYHPYYFLDYQSHADEQYGMANNLEGYAPPSPPYRVLMPETAGTYLKTESLARLINPVDRQVRPAGSPSFSHVMTEFGLAPGEFGVNDSTEAELLKAKTLLRGTFFWLNKGLEALWFFVDLGDGDPRGFDLVPETVTSLSRDPANPEAYMTPAMLALRNAVGILEGAQAGIATRNLSIEAGAADGQGGGIVFAGNGAHPPLTYQDVLAVLPFQVDDRTLVLATYVMGRNILESVPPISFVVRMTGVNGLTAQLQYLDPLSGDSIPVEVVERDTSSLTVRLPIGDYPHLLRIQD